MNSHFNYSVELTKGCGRIKFGATPEEVQTHLGAPNQSEILDPGTDSTLAWIYFDYKLQVVFQEFGAATGKTKSEKCVTQFTGGNSELTLWGKKIIGSPKDEMFKLFNIRGYKGFTQCKDPLEKLGYESFCLTSIRVTLDFKHGLLQHVVWGITEHVIENADAISSKP